MFEILASCFAAYKPSFWVAEIVRLRGFAFRCSASLLMNTADRCAWWNIGLWPVCPAEIFSAASQSAPKAFGAGRTDWNASLCLYTRAYRRKYPVFISASKNQAIVLGKPQHTTSLSQAENCLPRYNVIHERILNSFESLLGLGVREE